MVPQGGNQIFLDLGPHPGFCLVGTAFLEFVRGDHTATIIVYFSPNLGNAVPCQSRAGQHRDPPIRRRRADYMHCAAVISGGVVGCLDKGTIRLVDHDQISELYNALLDA